MLNYISGTIKNIEPQLLTIENSGFGFLIAVPNESLYCLNQKINLNIYFYWNQETGPQLFGFESKIEREIFLLIISCSGIGPKLGLLILSQINYHDFITAIALSNKAVLSTINGLGPKKIDMLILQLKDKANKLILNNSENTENNIQSCQNNIISKLKEISDVLSSLNYSKQEISITLDTLKLKNDLSSLTFDQMLKQALINLAKKY